MRIAIVGAGWFGCCIAEELIALGHDVSVFDAANEPFSGASGHNQNRLHLGFHYPRSHQTRQQTKVGFEWFTKRYPAFSSPVPENIYAVCRDESLVDFETYFKIMRPLPFRIRDAAEFGLENIDGCLGCGERRINTALARDWFWDTLGPHLYLGCRVRELYEIPGGVIVNGERYDLAVNCTNQTFVPHADWDIGYEPCVTLVYESEPNHPAITLMDGPFFTIYPLEGNLFTVYSVVHTRQGRFSLGRHAQSRLNGLSVADVRRIRSDIETQILRYYPAFPERFRFVDVQRCIRAIFPGRSDPRMCVVGTDSRIMQVMAGKVDAVCFAISEVRQCVDRYCSPEREAASARNYTKSSRPMSESSL